MAGNVTALCMLIELMLTPARSLRRTLRITAVIDNFPSFGHLTFGKSFGQALHGLRRLVIRGRCGDFGTHIVFKYVLVCPLRSQRSTYHDHQYETALEVKDTH